MAGFRTFILAAGLAFAVSLMAPQQQPPLLLEAVNAGQGLMVMTHEVTIAQWQQCFDDGGCHFMPKPGPGASDAHFPVTGVGALDAQEFVGWAQKRTGLPVALPTLEQWYGFSEVLPVISVKRFSDPRLAWAATYGSEGKIDPTLKRPGGFGANRKAIADVTGNVWEWTSSCVVDAEQGRCPAFFAAGSHEAKVPVFVRDPSSGGCSAGTPPAHLGLRLVWPIETPLNP